MMKAVKKKLMLQMTILRELATVMMSLIGVMLKVPLMSILMVDKMIKNQMKVRVLMMF